MRICSVKGCNNKHYGNGYCSRHYDQIRNYGKILYRTIHDPNEYYFCRGVVYIYLYNNKHEHIASAIIDREDFDKVKYYKWRLNNSGYVLSSKVGLLHRFILDCPKGFQVDHISYNLLDNSRGNVRICNNSQNQMNKKVKGVSYYKNKWVAYILIINVFI